MAENNSRGNEVVDEYLESVQDMKEAETDVFFYTRLKARMERQASDPASGAIRLKPALLIAMLTIMLIINSFIIVKQPQTNELQDPNDFGSYSITLSNY